MSQLLLAQQRAYDKFTTQLGQTREITIQLEGYPSDVWAATRQLEAAGFKILNQHERCVLLVGRITPDTYNAQSQSFYFKAMRRG